MGVPASKVALKEIKVGPVSRRHRQLLQNLCSSFSIFSPSSLFLLCTPGLSLLHCFHCSPINRHLPYTHTQLKPNWTLCALCSLISKTLSHVWLLPIPTTVIALNTPCCSIIFSVSHMSVLKKSQAFYLFVPPPIWYTYQPVNIYEKERKHSWTADT